jgi:hypothetical protein
VNNVANLHPEKRHILIDGRNTSTIADSKSFALFWIISKGKESKDCNCVVKHLSMSVAVHTDCEKLGKTFATLPTEAEDGLQHKEKAFPQVPVITNHKAISVGDRLVVQEDANIQKALADEAARTPTEAASSSSGKRAAAKGAQTAKKPRVL